MEKYCIVGFGNAGYQAAKAIRERAPTAEIHICADEGQAPSNPMLTTYHVRGDLAYDALFPYGASTEQIGKGLRLCFHGRAAGVLPDNRLVKLMDGGTVAYDKLLIATGATAFRPNAPGMDLKGVFVMRTPRDAARFKKALDTGQIGSLLVVGASMVGIKMVELAYRRCMPCTLVDGAASIFPLAALPNTARYIEADLKAKGVTLAFNALLSKIVQAGGEDGALEAVMADGRTFAADAIAVCIGTRANTTVADELGIERNRGILVDRKMRTSRPDIYAAGDCCEGYELQFREQRVIGLWANAGYQGRTAGLNMAGGQEEFDYTILHNITHFMDMDFLSFGDATTHKPGDASYEYDSDDLYCNAVKGEDGRVRCINMLGGASVSGIIKNIFMKSMTGAGPGADRTARGVLLSSGVPREFLTFLGAESGKQPTGEKARVL